MIALYIIIGMAIGAVAVYLVMDKRLDAVNIASGKKDIELAMRQELLSAVPYFCYQSQQLLQNMKLLHRQMSL